MNVVGLAARPAKADDWLRLRGAALGGWLGLRFDTRLPTYLRLGAGILLGSVTDARSGTVSTRTGSAEFGTLVEEHDMRFFYLAPEVRVSARLSPHVELTLGVELLMIINPSPPRWDDTHAFNAPGDGYAMFGADPLVAPFLLFFLPGIGARYDL